MTGRDCKFDVMGFLAEFLRKMSRPEALEPWLCRPQAPANSGMIFAQICVCVCVLEDSCMPFYSLLSVHQRTLVVRGAFVPRV